MKDRIDELLEVTYDNNRMLKEIIKYINYINSNNPNQDSEDFLRNVIANVVSSTLPDLKKFKK